MFKLPPVRGQSLSVVVSVKPGWLVFPGHFTLKWRHYLKLNEKHHWILSLARQGRIQRVFRGMLEARTWVEGRQLVCMDMKMTEKHEKMPGFHLPVTISLLTLVLLGPFIYTFLVISKLTKTSLKSTKDLKNNWRWRCLFFLKIYFFDI